MTDFSFWLAFFRHAAPALLAASVGFIAAGGIGWLLWSMRDRKRTRGNDYRGCL